MTPVERVLATARAELGYLEKASNAQLDSRIANAGDKNYTKYARDLDALGVYDGKKNGYPWCDVFVDWCLIQTFGLETALKMTGQKLGCYGAGCTMSMSYYRAMGRFCRSDPKPGDQIFFSQDGGKTSYHTGLVERVQGGRVYTIEGNTSSAAVTAAVVYEYHRLDTVMPAGVVTALLGLWDGELLIVALRQIFGSDVMRKPPEGPSI